VHIGQYFTSLLGLLVLFGVLAMVLKNGPAVNNIATATGQSIAGLTHAVEGRY
jgi:hypothetical protein